MFYLSYITANSLTHEKPIMYLPATISFSLLFPMDTLSSLAAHIKWNINPHHIFFPHTKDSGILTLESLNMASCIMYCWWFLFALGLSVVAYNASGGMTAEFFSGKPLVLLLWVDSTSVRSLKTFFWGKVIYWFASLARCSGMLFKWFCDKLLQAKEQQHIKIRPKLR